jgi:hypothetical protein
MKLSCCFLLIFFQLWNNSGANRSGPHPHQGVLKPYDGKPFDVHLKQEDLAQLEKGEPVKDSSVSLFIENPLIIF